MNGERPRLLLVPEFTELEWAIAPKLADWAEVATYDPPGVGGEPVDPAVLEAVERRELSLRDLLARRGLEELDRLGWDRFFLVSDAWGNAVAAEIALERPEAVEGFALGHACLSFDMDGERPVVSREVWAAMRQMLEHDHRDFIRYAIVQMTHGSVDEETAQAMLERYPDGDIMRAVWDSLPDEDTRIEEALQRVRCPLLFVQHLNCLSFSPEGFEDAAGAFPEAKTVRLASAPGGSEEFAQELREFCEEVSRSRGG